MASSSSILRRSFISLSRPAHHRFILNNGTAVASAPRRTMSTSSSVVPNNTNNVGSIKSNSSFSRISSSPWLMLPSVYDKNLYKFYSIADKKVFNIISKSIKSFMSHDDYEEDLNRFVSSCHGWLALNNWKDLFLFNPITGRHIKLPSTEDLAPDMYGNVENLIISCSPEEQDCRVMMIFGDSQSLAFCCPNISAEWTISNDFHDGDDYQDFVYSSRHKLLYCTWGSKEEMEVWDVENITSPKFIPMELTGVPASGVYRYLVVDEESGNLFVVLENKTNCFDVYKYDTEKRELKYMEGRGSLDGLAIFIGANRSFAISANEYSELQPNSIYFTGEEGAICIFNYEDRTLSSCYNLPPFDMENTRKPMWFTPSIN